MPGVRIVNEQPGHRVHQDLVTYYNLDRPRQALRVDPPEHADRSLTDPIRSRLVLCGLHHMCERSAGARQRCVRPSVPQPVP